MVTAQAQFLHAAAATGSARGFAGLAMAQDACRIDLWWKGQVPARVVEAVQRVTAADVVVHDAAHSAAELAPLADELTTERFLVVSDPDRTIAVAMETVTPRDDGSGIDVQISAASPPSATSGRPATTAPSGTSAPFATPDMLATPGRSGGLGTFGTSAMSGVADTRGSSAALAPSGPTATSAAPGRSGGLGAFGTSSHAGVPATSGRPEGLTPWVGELDEAGDASLAERVADVLTARVGVPVAVEVVAGSPGEWGRFDDSPPWHGGARSVHPGDRCTTGFGIRDRRGGGRWLLTAAHCTGGQDGPVRSGAGVLMGTVTEHEPGLDSTRIPVEGRGSNRIYDGRVGGGDDDHMAVVRGTAANFRGQFVCQSGASSGEVCDLRIEVVDQRRWSGTLGRYVHDVVVAEQTTGPRSGAPGDSGGPVYRRCAVPDPARADQGPVRPPPRSTAAEPTDRDQSGLPTPPCLPDEVVAHGITIGPGLGSSGADGPRLAFVDIRSLLAAWDAEIEGRPGSG